MSKRLEGDLGITKEIKVRNLKVQYFKSALDTKSELSVKIPFSFLNIAISFLPRKLSAILEKEGIDISNSKELVKEKQLTGTIIEIEDDNGKITISVE